MGGMSAAIGQTIIAATLPQPEDNMDTNAEEGGNVRSPPNVDGGYPFSLSSILRLSDGAYLLLIGHNYKIYTFVFHIV